MNTGWSFDESEAGFLCVSLKRRYSSPWDGGGRVLGTVADHSGFPIKSAAQPLQRQPSAVRWSERPTSVSVTTCLSLSLASPSLARRDNPGFEMEHPTSSESPYNPFRSDTPDQPVFNEPLLPPAVPFLAPSEGTPTPRDSYLTNNSATHSAPLLPESGEKDLPEAANLTARKSKPLYKRPLIWVLALAALGLIIVAVIVPVYFTVIKPKNNTVSGGNSNGPNNNGNGNNDNPTHQPPTTNTSGGNGSTITTSDGTQFTYINPFGGICE